MCTGLLTLPAHSCPHAVRHWALTRQRGTSWAGGLRTSQTCTSGSQRTLVQKLQILVVSVIRGRDDVSSVLAEGETLQEIEAFLEKRGMDEKSIKKQLCKLDRIVSPAQAVPLSAASQPLQSQLKELGRRHGAAGSSPT